MLLLKMKIVLLPGLLLHPASGGMEKDKRMREPNTKE
jgi:hypothetical protein